MSPPLSFELADPVRKPSLLAGWSDAERSADGRTGWVWAIARQARIQWRLTSPDYAALVLHGWPAPPVEQPPLRLVLSVNGRDVGKVDLVAGHFTYRIELPEGSLRRGENVLGFDFERIALPTESDSRSLAAAFSYLELVPRDGEPAAHKVDLSDEIREAVSLRPGIRWRRTLEAPPGAEWSLAYGLYCPPDEHCRGPRTFLVEAGTVHRRVPVFHRTVKAGTASPRWWTHRLRRADLPAESIVGSKVELVFSVVRPEKTGEDGGAAIEPRALWGLPLPILPAASSRPYENVVLISIDTLRADRLGSYGYRRPTSPALDALAGEGVRFSQAISHSPWTTPSHMSLMTSRYPSSHRVNQSWVDLGSSPRAASEVRGLAQGVTTLAEILRDRGYRTLALTGGTTLVGRLGFWRGFDVYHEGFGDRNESFYKLDERVETKLAEWLDTYGGAPFFLFFHTFEVHAPYVGTELVQELFTADQRAQLRDLLARPRANPVRAQRRFLEEQGLFDKVVTSALYDGGVRRVDAFLGRLFDDFRRHGLFEKTLWIITSDHGEEFGEHDPRRFYNAHCDSVYDEVLHVPLIFRLPGGAFAGQVVDRQVEQIDVAPTILDLLDISVPAEMEGRSLKGWIEGDPPPSRAAGDEPRAVSEAACQGLELKSFRTSRHKYVAAYALDGGDRTGLAGSLEWEQIFDLETDPGEQRSLHEDSDLLAHMRFLMTEHFRALAERAGVELGTPVEADLEALRALGYVD